MPQRFSQQRERIYQTVLESRAHPTAEMVYQQLKPEMPRLSLGTVYRNLQQMAREGRLTELDGPVTRFDAVTRPHTHFRCRACGAVLDLETVPYDERLDRCGPGLRGHGPHPDIHRTLPALCGTGRPA